MKHFANDHERAFDLLCATVSESASATDRMWLENHLRACAECRLNNEQMQAVISTLRTVSVSAGNDLVRSTQRRIRALCLHEETRQRKMRPVWISAAFASVWMACSAPYLWQSFDLTGHWLHIPDLLWQMGFLITWFTPALTGATVAFWLRPQLTRGVRAQVARATA